jgi:hypothetical protein
MPTIRRFTALLVLILSVLGIAVCLVAVLGAWVANLTMTGRLVSAAENAQNILIQTQQTLQAADAGLQSLQAPLQSLSGALDLLKTFVPDAAKFVDQARSMGDLQTKVTTAETQVSTLIGILGRVTGLIPAAMILSAVLITIFLFWAAISQVALFIHAWYFYTGQDLLARWRAKNE